MTGTKMTEEQNKFGANLETLAAATNRKVSILPALLPVCD
jgi:hypothetical protein